MTLIEVLIAALLLTVVISSLALAVSSGLRAQSSAKASKSLYAVAQRVFESIQADRGWMDGCTTLGQQCALTVDSSLLEDKAAGSACTGGGTYHHELKSAYAIPVDSAVDGVGAADSDQRIPDYYTVHVEVAVPACAKARLGGPDPAVFESAVDRNGKIPQGSLEVEFCSVKNQIDERMSLSSCAPGGGSQVDLLGCISQTAAYVGPAGQCNNAYPKTAGRSGLVPFSRSVVLTRVATNFIVTDANGVTVGSSGTAIRPTTGIYQFPNLKAGVYFIKSIGAPGGQQIWTTKVIPAMNGANVTGIVQPDVKSRILVAFQPINTAMLRFTFQRIVTIRNVTHHEARVEEGDQNPASKWEGSRTQVQAYANALNAYYSSKMATQSKCGIGPDQLGTKPPSFYSTDVTKCWHSVDVKYDVKDGYGVPMVNCVFIIPTIVELGSQVNTIKVRRSCAYFRMYSIVKWYQVDNPSGATQQRDGPAVSASYSSEAMPTFREVVPNSDPNSCVGASVAGGLRKLRPFGACVTGRSTPAASIGAFAPGLNAGLTSVDGSAYTGKLYKDGTGWTTSRNETVRAIPAALKAPNALWANGNTITSSAGGTWRSGSTIPVVGTGECYWTYEGGAERQGPCNPCNPWLQPENGWADGCYILYHVQSWRQTYCTVQNLDGSPVSDGTASAMSCTSGWHSDDVDVTKACTGDPLGGTWEIVAPNCKTDVDIIGDTSTRPWVKGSIPAWTSETNITAGNGGIGTP